MQGCCYKLPLPCSRHQGQQSVFKQFGSNSNLPLATLTHLAARLPCVLLRACVLCSDGMSYEQIAEQMPEEYAARKKDKLGYRCGVGCSADAARRKAVGGQVWGVQRLSGVGFCTTAERLVGSASACLHQHNKNLPQRLSSGPAQDAHVQFSCLRNLPAAALLNLNSAVSTCGRRYPSGESYMDVIQRLEPVIIEVERQKDSVCIVGHQAILRVIVGQSLVRIGAVFVIAMQQAAFQRTTACRQHGQLER